MSFKHYNYIFFNTNSKSKVVYSTSADNQQYLNIILQFSKTPLPRVLAEKKKKYDTQNVVVSNKIEYFI